ncbi:MAG: hypothetical protein H5T64_10515 [Chloroflexi bacterium]|nr:hypothetical protein [Chloroflexota bacterium]
MQSVNLAGFLSRATAYESWRAPIDHHLRRATILAGPTILAGLLLILVLPSIVPVFTSDFFLVLGDQFGQILWALYQCSPFLATLNLASLVMYLVLLVATRGLSAGRAQYHWVAFFEVVIGAANGFVMALELAIIVVNIVLWIVIICLCVAAALAMLYGLASS